MRSRPGGPVALLRHGMSRGFSLGLGALSGLFLPILTRTLWFPSLPGRLLRADTPAPSDIIHVLGGGLGSPITRIDQGAALFHLGLAPRILLTGTGNGINWAERNRRRALDLGVPDEALILDPRPRSTRIEARTLKRLCARESWDRVMVVTEAFHAGRAARLFERALHDRGVRVLSCPAELPGFPPGRWWQDMRTRSLLLGEAARLLLARTTGSA